MASPYQFEPEIPSGDENNSEECASEESGSEEDVRNEERLTVDIETWCTCEQCVVMEKAEMCLCCNELESRKYDNSPDTCITASESFQVVCLNREVLWTALVSLHDREGSPLPSRTNIPNNSLRYASYRQFTWWVHGHLGKKIRRVIPACVVSKIRNYFPDPNDQYTGFKDAGNELSELNLAWEF